MMFRALACSFLLAVFCGVSSAQETRRQSPIAGADRSSSGSESSIMTGTPEAEMMARRDIRAAEKEEMENLERAREAAQLSAEIRTTFLKNQLLGRTEMKKLDRLEKLTRRIREYAGGSEAEVTLENVPQQLEPALGQLSEYTEAMRKAVEKTPRQVVSASVIERTNELLELIRYVRALIR
jgi:DNA repair ATPase RecN